MYFNALVLCQGEAFGPTENIAKCISQHFPFNLYGGVGVDHLLRVHAAHKEHIASNVHSGLDSLLQPPTKLFSIFEQVRYRRPGSAARLIFKYGIKTHLSQLRDCQY